MAVRVDDLLLGVVVINIVGPQHGIDNVRLGQRQPALEIIVNALDLVYIPAFVAAAVALVVSLLIKVCSP